MITGETAAGAVIAAIICMTALFLILKKTITKKQISVGENGVWIIKRTGDKNDITKPQMKHISRLKSESRAVQHLIREKTGLAVKVQPVLVLGNTKTDLKFRLYHTDGVYVVQHNWLDKLILEYPVQRLTTDKITAIKKVVSKSGE